ncbi:MAG TPA: metal-sensitive transcriptional regulator [Patescibacteria group bacterium]|nr:metal-sensitive transcriptional regulator [Patescibacteria group bacterium]
MLDQKLKKKALHRIKIIEGQARALAKAIESEVYCTDLLNQSFSMQKSLKSLDSVLLENHLKSHVSRQFQQKGQQDKAVQELLEVFGLANR